MTPRLRSGMTFRTNDGITGLLVGTDNGLVALFQRDGSYATYGDSVDKYVGKAEDSYGTLFSEVWEGMNTDKRAGINRHITDLSYSGSTIWKREPAISVKLNESYTASLDGDTVTVGCQKIPLSAIRELVRKADER